MAAVARDNRLIVRIPRKVILGEILKRIGGMETQYRCWLDEGRYRCMANTVIMVNEENPSGKFEQACGHYANTEAEAEEEAAIALIEKLKLVYRFEVDDINFVERARNECRREQLEQEISIVQDCRLKEGEISKRLKKGWTMLLKEMENVQEGIEDMCGAALATLPVAYVCGPYTDLIGSVCSLDAWLECKISESAADLKDGSDGL